MQYLIPPHSSLGLVGANVCHVPDFPFSRFFHFWVSRGREAGTALFAGLETHTDRENDLQLTSSPHKISPNDHGGGL